MDPSSSSLSSSLKRDRDSPAEVKPVGTKVRILPLRMRVFLLFSMGAPAVFFNRGERSSQTSRPVAARLATTQNMALFDFGFSVLDFSKKKRDLIINRHLLGAVIF